MKSNLFSSLPVQHHHKENNRKNKIKKRTSGLSKRKNGGPLNMKNVLLRMAS